MKKLVLIFFLLCSPCWAGVSFDGADDKIACGDVELVTRNLSISAWVYPTADVSGFRGYIFSKCCGIVSYAFDADGTATPENLGILVQGASGLFACQAQEADTSTILPTNTWTHVLVTRSGTNCAIYINGTSQTIDVNNLVDEDFQNSTDDIVIGGRDSDTLRQWNGYVNEVYLYNTSLTQTNATLLSSSRLKGVGLQISGVVGYWPLNDKEAETSGDGDTFRDMASGANGTGDDGANNTGLTLTAETILNYPQGMA